MARESALLTADEQRAVTERAARVEAATGVEIVVAAVAKSDTYPEIPWKAFALGVATGVLGVAIAALLAPAWSALHPIVLGAVVLATGAVLSLASVFCLPVARSFLDPHRADLEVRQHAAMLFRGHRLDRTQRRAAALLLVSRFERRAHVLVDAAVADRVADVELETVVARVAEHARRGDLARAMIAALDALESTLIARGFVGPAGADEIRGGLLADDGPAR